MKHPLVVLSTLVISCVAKNVQKGFHYLEFNVSIGDTFVSSSPLNKPRLVKRDTPSGATEIEIENQSTFYSVELQIGSEGEKVIVLVDTGSSDLWVSGSDNPYCISGTATQATNSKFKAINDLEVLNKVFDSPNFDKFRSISPNEITSDSLTQKRDKNDVEANGNVLDSDKTESNNLPSDTIKKSKKTQSSGSSIATMDCSTFGVFNKESSTSFKSNDSSFLIVYGDNTYAQGTWGYDNIKVDDLEVKNFSFAVANKSNSSMGVLGIGLAGLETTNSDTTPSGIAYTYENLPLKLVSEGIIHKSVYSLWLNSRDESSGTVLFGAIDHAKYENQLTIVPIINTLSKYYKNPAKLEITLSSISIKGNQVTSQSYAALLDSGTTLTYLPILVLSSIASAVGAEYSQQLGYYLIDCPSSSNNDTITYSFQGVDINISLLDLIFMLDGSNSVCALSILKAKDSVILGDSFLRSAYIVYDLDEYQVALAQAVFTDAQSIEVITSTIPGAVSAASYSATYDGKESTDIADADTTDANFASITADSTGSKGSAIYATASSSPWASNSGNSGASNVNSKSSMISLIAAVLLSFISLGILF